LIDEIYAYKSADRVKFKLYLESLLMTHYTYFPVNYVSKKFTVFDLLKLQNEDNIFLFLKNFFTAKTSNIAGSFF